MIAIDPARFPSKYCERCGTVFTKTKKDSAKAWAKRKFCSNKCVNVGRIKRPMIERLMDGIEIIPESGCWIWMKSTDGDGYGTIGTKFNEQNARVHRVSYEHFVGEIPKDAYVIHKCGIGPCCNPYHLGLRYVHRRPITKISKAIRSMTQRYTVIDGIRQDVNQCM